ncbi:hypothetical protein [Mycobacteroides salmoniphilum]|uniref:hypothetical protein n=1 Tax=Mycobacteroides salmoniphilum TaxID=404941 RepID=UPI003B96801B
MRHTRSSLAIKSGANIKVVQKLLGHKSAVLTPGCTGICSRTIWTPLQPLSIPPRRSTADALRTDRPQRPQAPSRGGLSAVAGAGFEPA